MTMIIDGTLGLEFPDGSDQTVAYTGNASTITTGVLAAANGGTGTTSYVATQWTTSGANISYTTGSVGIGTSSPVVALEVQKSAGNSLFRNVNSTATTTFITVVNANNTTNGLVAAHINDGTGYFGTQNSAALRLVTGDTERMRITSAGNVGIGNSATSPSGLLTLRDTNDIAFNISKAGVGSFDITNAGTSGVTLGTQDPYILGFKTNNTERMRIAADGTVTVGGNNILGVGISQSWTNVGGSRSSGTTYTNSTGRPIQLMVATDNTGNTTYNSGGSAKF